VAGSRLEADPALYGLAALSTASPFKRISRRRSLCRRDLSGIADRDVIAFGTHFEVALVESDD
jgi:hypothetical protein